MTLALCVSGTFSLISTGNNLNIGVPTLSVGNVLSFTVSWDNSWYTTSAPQNWDGVYLFVKYRDCASSGAWSQAKLSTTVSDHSADSPLMVDSYQLNDGIGVIVHRSSAGYGNISAAVVQLKLTTPAAGPSYDFQIFGIEMVYVPNGPFYLGDGGASSYSITSGSSANALLVSSDGALTRGTAAGNIYCNASPTTLPGNVPAAYPLGYDSLYVMKYEISQGQYVGFLNALASDQAANRFPNVNASRTNITGTWPNYTTIYPYRACGYLSWQDLTAYLDWAGMRPMTETEYEKICRGPNIPVANEYAWGTNTYTYASVGGISNDATTTEKNTSLPASGTGMANAGGGILGPLRCGFASGPATDRLQAGSSYYGVMELSGNIWELCVGLYANGLAYTGTRGDGVLSTTPSPGYANTASWPSLNSNVNGVSARGGAYNNANTYLYVSGRTIYDTYTVTSWDNVTRNGTLGGRGIR